jgi:hypothetical protein
MREGRETGLVRSVTKKEARNINQHLAYNTALMTICFSFTSLQFMRQLNSRNVDKIACHGNGVCLREFLGAS